jgi:transposase
LQITALDLVDELITLHVVSTTPEAACPCCLQVARRVHSRYTRTVADLACGGHRLQLILHVRKFFCRNTDCAQKIFTERLSPFVEPWARMTTRLSQEIEAMGLATCARLGTRLGLRLGVETSRMSILRRIMKLPIPSAATVSCLGLDDFSFQRGRTFGTVRVDLERHQMVDLLPDRQTETAATWMRRRGSSQMQMVSRQSIHFPLKSGVLHKIHRSNRPLRRDVENGRRAIEPRSGLA